MPSTSLAWTAPVLVSFVVAACGGQIAGGSTDENAGPGGGRGDAGPASTTTGSGSAEAGTAGATGKESGGGTMASDAPVCVTIDFSTYDTSCVQDTDCASINVGQICSPACLCGGEGAIATSERARYANAVSSVAEAADACPVCEGFLAFCVEGQCSLCRGLPGDPPGCFGSLTDGGLEGMDSGADCVDLDLSTYDTSCVQTSDCIDVTGGEICPDSCFCGGSTVNISEETRYKTTLASTPFLEQAQTNFCGCPFFGSPTCVAGQCVMCLDLGDTDGGCDPLPPK